MYLRSVKWHSTLAARRFAAAPETHPLSFHAHTCCCWHACFRSSQTAKHSTRDDDACFWKWRVSPLHLSSPEILTLNRRRFVFAQNICLFVCLFYLMSLFVFVLFVLLQKLVFIFSFRNLWFVLDVWDKVQHWIGLCFIYLHIYFFMFYLF